MSGVANVLMGIIGATVTMGVASVGTSSLSPRYEDAQTTARAVMALSAVKQTNAAVIMARTVDGGVEPGLAGVQKMVADGWLSRIPDNPTSFEPSAAAMVAPAADGSRYIQMRLVGDNGSLCDEIARQVGMEAAPIAEVAPRTGAGCVRTSSGSIAYSRD